MVGRVDSVAHAIMLGCFYHWAGNAWPTNGMDAHLIANRVMRACMTLPCRFLCLLARTVPECSRVKNAPNNLQRPAPASVDGLEFLQDGRLAGRLLLTLNPWQADVHCWALVGGSGAVGRVGHFDFQLVPALAV